MKEQKSLTEAQEYALAYPLAPSHLNPVQWARYQEGMRPSASLEDQVFYLSCRFDGHSMLLNMRQREWLDLHERNRKNVARAWHYRSAS